MIGGPALQYLHGSSKADSQEATKVLELLKKYEIASGQQVNKEKSSIFYSTNVISYNRQTIYQTMQMLEANEHSTYLGLPNVIGRNKSALLGFLKDRVNMKVRSWDGIFISRAGKEILIKQVAQTLPSYAMNVFLLPLDITRNIEKSLSNFWWNSAQSNKSKLIWMNWDRLAKQKRGGGMGFRHFRDFNIAMLGKQLWRLATMPDSLVARMYKARYFANSDILHAELGHNPSFIWRSLLAAKPLLIAGIRWRIGNGKKIQILGQPWLLTKENPYITSDPEPLQNGMVASLFCTDQQEWDLEVVADVLNERDQECVLDIPLSRSNQEDNLFWSLEDTGIYSVKSAYRLLQSQKGEWNEEETDRVWQYLWKTKAPPKTLNLVWRALSDCLPTLTQLQIKRVPVQDTCPVCQVAAESIVHSLVTCQFASQCWVTLLPGIQLQETSCFRSWLLFIFNTVDKSKHADIITLCWSIWRSRNDLIWNQKPTKVNRTVAAARQYLAQWKVTQCRSYVPPLQPLIEGDGASIWVKPQLNSVKVSVDAAMFEDRGGVGFGLVARNSDGELLEAKAVFHPSLVTPSVAEAMAFKEALSWIDHQGWHEAIVESDCAVVVQAVRSKVPMKSYFGLIIEECRSMLRRLNKITLFFVKRSANMVAHQVARESYYLSGRSFDRNSIPRSIQNCITMDLSS